jgi:hypothetical protein
MMRERQYGGKGVRCGMGGYTYNGTHCVYSYEQRIRQGSTFDGDSRDRMAGYWHQRLHSMVPSNRLIR